MSARPQNQAAHDSASPTALGLSRRFPGQRLVQTAACVACHTSKSEHPSLPAHLYAREVLQRDHARAGPAPEHTRRLDPVRAAEVPPEPVCVPPLVDVVNLCKRCPTQSRCASRCSKNKGRLSFAPRKNRHCRPQENYCAGHLAHSASQDTGRPVVTPAARHSSEADQTPACCGLGRCGRSEGWYLLVQDGGALSVHGLEVTAALVLGIQHRRNLGQLLQVYVKQLLPGEVLRHVGCWRTS